jgi:hypothetical protein
MNFKVGDKVRVRKDLKVGDGLISCSVLGDMIKFAGEFLTITRVRNEFYDVKENCWNWTDNMLEPIPIEVGDTVRINKKATIEDITKNHWNGCCSVTVNFIKEHGDEEETFVVEGLSIFGNLLIKGETINSAIFELVSKKEPEIKELTIPEIEAKFGCKVKIIKEDK